MATNKCQGPRLGAQPGNGGEWRAPTQGSRKSSHSRKLDHAETGRDKINGAGGGRDSPRADPSYGDPECEYPCHQENNGQGRKGSADPSSGNFTSPFASKGTCVLEFGQGGGFNQPPWRNCVRVCACMGVSSSKVCSLREVTQVAP